jgi:hypothetical protein
MPNDFKAAAIGSVKSTGQSISFYDIAGISRNSACSGMSAFHAPLSIATCNGSARGRIGLMFPKPSPPSGIV